MSSPDEDEGSVWRAEVDSEYRERAGIVDLPLGSPQSSEGGDKGEGEGKGQGELAGEGGFPHPEGFLAQQHVMQAGGLEQQDCEGQMGSLADFEGGTLACFGTRSLTGIPQGLSEGDTQGVRRSPSQEPCDREASTMWLDPEPAPSGTGVVAYGLEGLQLASGAPFHLREPKGGWAWGSPSKRARCRSKASVSCQHPFEEEPDCSPRPVSKSSDQVSEMRLMRLIISQEQGDQPKPTSPSDTPGHSRTDIREQFLPMPGPCLSSTPRLSSGVERQGVDDLEVPPKKPESMITGKAGVRPIYLPLVVAAGGLPKASPRRKVSKQKTYQWRASEVAPGSFFPSWWQRDSGGLEDPATFPPISDVLLPGRGRRHSLAPFGTKESKPTGTGPKSMAQRRRVSKPVVGEGEDKEQERDGFPECQVSIRPCFSLVPTLLLPTPAHLYLCVLYLSLRGCYWVPSIIRMPDQGGFRMANLKTALLVS